MFKTVFLFQSAGEELFFHAAARRLEKELFDAASFLFFDINSVDGDEVQQVDCRRALETADFVYISVHGGIPYFKSFSLLSRLFLDRTPCYLRSGIEDENREFAAHSAMSPILYARLSDFYEAGGERNCEALLRCVLRELGGLNCEVPEIEMPVWDGLFGLAENENEEMALARAADFHTHGPVVGILVHYHNISHRNTAHIEALMQRIRERGGWPLAVYTNMMPAENYGGLVAVIDRYFMHGGSPLIDTLIVTVGHSLTALAAPGEGSGVHFESVFARLGVPVIQAMTTFFTRSQWEASTAGLDQMLLCSNVYQPEFDGQIISVPIGCTEAEQTPDGIRYVTVPIPDRVHKAAGLALGWARLRRKPMREKKVAVILHNMPPRADMIGCAYGLDTPESVYGMAEALYEQGLPLDYRFENGQEIIGMITRALTNDCRFLSADEMLRRCEKTIGEDRWRTWFSVLSERVQSELRRDWGDPPGDFMTVDGRILIPGIHNGNLFIGLQPPRAFEEKAEAAYHSTDLVCPYQYIAFYRYLTEDFGADVVVHVGTHGTLEWLPGKEIGLSSNCYPDAVLGEVPHLYPYIIDVPGEGAQAKRRSDAVILDHLIPSMAESGLYGALSEMDDVIGQYHHAVLNDPGKAQLLAARIWELCEAQNLNRDLGLMYEAFVSDPAAGMEKMHLWLSEIKRAKIKNGLHIFGIPPRDGRYADMLRLLVTLRNGKVPSLREGLCALYGIDLEAMLSDPAALDGNGESNARRLERIDEAGRQIFDAFARRGFAAVAVAELVDIAADGLNGDTGPLSECLRYVASVLAPKLNETTDELKNFLRGVRGEFVPQGPSGAPSRGNAEILPTGRNFFMIDPTAVPGRAAWETGKRLADDLIAKHKAEQGAVPESVAIVVYSGETIKTTGDDIAEILWLYGVRPVWLARTDCVIGLEIVPLAELGRPRIDVTLRISGLFRDTFPNLIERIEDAVNLVAALDEPDEDNCVKKHVSQDMRDYLAEGMDRERAFDYARLRVFGCPPGTYGAGVDILVNSKQWQTSDDLGAAYINWSAHAYGKNFHGETVRDVFARRLAQTDATVKNISSYESDMLDSDDFYNYHGGLISAVKAQRGTLPASYSTNAGDPQHVETRTIHEETSRIMRARIANPKWVEGLREHGYRGAQELSSMVDIVFGWDATSSVVDDWMYETIAQQYLFNDDLREWIHEVNPWALHAMSERLLEASRRGMWDADEDRRLSEIYLEAEGDMEEL